MAEKLHKLNSYQIMTDQNDTKSKIIKYLLKEKEDSYRNMMAMQQSEVNSAGKSAEEGENMFDDGKPGQVLNRVEARSSVVEALQRDINILSGLHSIEPNEEIQLGDVIETDQGNFFVAVAADEFTVDGKSYHGISTESPLFKSLLGKRNGDSVSVNDQTFTLQNSY